MKIVYIDFDGVLGVFDTTKSLEEVAKPGYSLTVPLMKEMCDAIKMLKEDDTLAKKFSFKPLSAAIALHAERDKTQVLQKAVDDQFASDAVFVQYGTSKSQYAEGGNILIDDFSFNLHEWEAAGGIGIKVYNGINGSHGTWTGYSVHSKAKPEVIYRTIKGILTA